MKLIKSITAFIFGIPQGIGIGLFLLFIAPIYVPVSMARQAYKSKKWVLVILESDEL